ncbi:cysteine-rich venom protein Mr30-like isoform X2 [Babylonia areolata]
MRMSWHGSAVLLIVTALMLLLVCADIKDTPGVSERRKRAAAASASLCDPRYKAISPTHTRCATPHPQAKLRRLNNAAKLSILRQHNHLRSSVDPPAANMMKLIWDARLAKSAEMLAMQCVGNHDDMKDRREFSWPLVKIGQNLGIGHPSFQSMIDRFHSEKEQFNYQYGMKYIKGIGHWFQIVAYESTRMGCAEASCPNLKGKVLRVCNYAPAMNAGIPPYRNGTWCSACPNNCDASGKLCDCKGKLCFNGGEIDPATCECRCQPGKTGTQCEKVDCKTPEPSNCGRHPKSNCGKPGMFMHDPTMCPFLCEICPKPCRGLECQNGGKLNWNTCKCNCTDGFRGRTCENCPAQDPDYCTLLHLKDQCGLRIATTQCPIFCGACKTRCKPCENFGALNTDTCKCTCKGGFTGAQCEKCPKNDENFCHMLPKSYCTTINRGQAPMMLTKCPNFCDICP